VVALAVLLACGSTEPRFDITGNWGGQIKSSLSGNGALTLTVVQSGTNLSGTWSAIYSNPADNTGGSLTGSINGTNLEAALSPGNPLSCPVHATGILNGSTISGTFAVFNCTVSASGTFLVIKF
jgi:hypothetical protein